MGVVMAEAAAASEANERELLRRAQEDPDGEAFRLVFEAHQREVYRFLLRLVGDASLAEDLLQETFLRVYQHLDRYDPQRAFRPWLFRIARNEALNALRALSKGKTAPLQRDGAGSGRVPRAAAAAEAADEVREALEALDPEERALLVQRHGLGMKLAALAESLDCTERTVRNRLQRAVGALTRALLRRRREGGSQ